MPPVTKAGSQQFRKTVEFAATKDSDEYELEATGIVMVPDKADLQNDFARADTIQSFADQFETFVEAGEAGPGVMHAVFPDDWMDLDRNEVLDEAAEIGGRTVDAGAWVQTWGVTDAELADLIDDDILSGYSIGAIQVDWNGPFEQDDVDDVDTSELPEGELVWELTDGIIREVSAVDIPAVPDAQILEAKGLDKRLGDHLGNRDAFIEEAMERGHTEADANRLWDVLNDAMEVDGAADPGTKSMWARAGKAFFSVLSGSDDDHTAAASEAPEQTKDGQTLSASNRESAMAAVDANLDMLADAGMDVPKRFTDREDVDFDLTEHDARTWGGDHGEDDEDEGEEDAASATDNATGGDTPDDDTTHMSDTDGGGDDKTLAEKNAEQIDELTDAVKGLTEAVEADDDPDGDKTAEVELPDGTVAEVSKREVESWFEDDGGNSTEATPEKTAATKADIEAIHARLDSIVRESAGSQQLDQGGDNDPDSGLDDLGKALS